MCHKHLIASFLSVAFLGISMAASAQDADYLTGDTRLACEAILCLSSGSRPDECSPSLKRYFGIKYRNWKDTVNARRNFLQKCPTASDTSQNMPSLVEAIVNGAGRCDASYLNATLTHEVQQQACPSDSQGWGDEENCYYQTITIIDNQMPSYCLAYAEHEYTYRISPKYVGDPMDGGRWVDQ
jgi:hypothetical protein